MGEGVSSTPPIRDGVITEAMLAAYLRTRRVGTGLVYATSSSSGEPDTGSPIAWSYAASSQSFPVPAGFDIDYPLNTPNTIVASPDVATLSPWTYVAPRDGTLRFDVRVKFTFPSGLIGPILALSVNGRDGATCILQRSDGILASLIAPVRTGDTVMVVLRTESEANEMRTVVVQECEIVVRQI